MVEKIQFFFVEVRMSRCASGKAIPVTSPVCYVPFRSDRRNTMYVWVVALVFKFYLDNFWYKNVCTRIYVCMYISYIVLD